MAVKYHEKLKLLRDAAIDAATNLESLTIPGNPTPDVLQEVREVFVHIATNLRSEVLRVYPGARASMTPEEREQRARLRRFQKRQVKMTEQLRKMGLVKDARAIHQATGGQVVLAADPGLLATGIRIKVAPILPDGTLGEIREDDATAYRPDFSQPQTAEANSPKARRKARRSQPAAK